MRTRTALLFVFAILALALPLQAASKEWVHVHVENPKESEKVKVNIPVSLVEELLPLVEDKEIHNGTLHLQDNDIKVQDLRKAWQAVRDQGDGEYLSVEKPDQNLRVFTKGNFFCVETDGNSKDQVSMKIPMQVVDALLSGKGDELNLMDAIKALKESGVKDIVSIKSSDATVRVWIDEKNTQEL